MRSMQFHTVKAQPFGIRRGASESVDDFFNLGDAHGLRRLFQRVHVNSGWSDGRQFRIGQVLSLEGPGHAHVPKLGGYFAIRGMNGFQHLFPPPQGGPAEEVGVIGGRGGAGFVNKGSLRDDEPYFMFCPALVIGGHLVRRNPAGRKSPGHGRECRACVNEKAGTEFPCP